MSEVGYEIKKGEVDNAKEVVHVSRMLSYCDPRIPEPKEEEGKQKVESRKIRE